MVTGYNGSNSHHILSPQQTFPTAYTIFLKFTENARSNGRLVYFVYNGSSNTNRVTCYWIDASTIRTDVWGSTGAFPGDVTTVDVTGLPTSGSVSYSLSFSPAAVIAMAAPNPGGRAIVAEGTGRTFTESFTYMYISYASDAMNGWCNYAVVYKGAFNKQKQKSYTEDMFQGLIPA
jgi:hypothetical protein